MEDPRADHGRFDREADPELLPLGGRPPDDIAQSFELLEALRAWQRASRALATASERFMRLNSTDMRAIRFIIRSERRGQIVTLKDIARETGISGPSTTKLVDRLERAGHVRRTPHPTDRRTSSIRVTETTRRVARETIGRHHARRFEAAMSLTPDERAAAIRFLTRLTEVDSMSEAETEG